MSFEVYYMHYKGNKVTSELSLINYRDEFYEKYKKLCDESFYEMRVALNCKPYNSGPEKEEVLKKKQNIFLLIEDNEIAGAVSLYENEIDDLMVNKEYQGRGYGKKLLFFGISNLQKKGVKNIILRVTKWNSRAVNLYLKNGFEIIETITVTK